MPTDKEVVWTKGMGAGGGGGRIDERGTGGCDIVLTVPISSNPATKQEGFTPKEVVR